MQKYLDTTLQWFLDRGLSINTDKTKFTLFRGKQNSQLCFFLVLELLSRMVGDTAKSKTPFLDQIFFVMVAEYFVFE